jgi:hypothetical protein
MGQGDQNGEHKVGVTDTLAMTIYMGGLRSGARASFLHGLFFQFSDASNYVSKFIIMIVNEVRISFSSVRHVIYTRLDTRQARGTVAPVNSLQNSFAHRNARQSRQALREHGRY